MNYCDSRENEARLIVAGWCSKLRGRSCDSREDEARLIVGGWCSKLRGRSLLRGEIVVIVCQCGVIADCAALGIYMVLGVFRLF